MSGVGLLRVRIVALGIAIAAVLATGTWFALTRASAQEGAAHGGTAAQRHAAPSQPRTVAARPLRVVSVSPASRSAGVNGASPVRIVFSAALAADSPLPRLSPRIAGRWQRGSGDSLEFVPRRAFAPHAEVRLRIPAGASGVRSVAGGQLARPVVGAFPDRGVQHPAAPAAARAARVPAPELDAGRILRAARIRHERAAQCRFQPAAWHLHLATRLPEGAAGVLAAGRAQPDRDRGGHGLRVRPRHDDGRNGRPGRLDRAAQGGGERPAERARVHLRPRQREDPGDPDDLAQRTGRLPQFREHRDPGRADHHRHRPGLPAVPLPDHEGH